MIRFYRLKQLTLFSVRSIPLLLVIGVSNLIVTLFHLTMIMMKGKLSCVIGTMGSYSMVSILHFPYILRSLKHAVLSDVHLRAKFRLMTKTWFLCVLLVGHILFSLSFCVTFSSGLITESSSNQEKCGFTTYDGVYMLTTLILFVGASIWTISKIKHFEDRYNISSEIMYVYLIWIVLAVPYLVFEVFLKKRTEASYMMIVMNLALLYVSFHLPLQSSNGANMLRTHPVIKLLRLIWRKKNYLAQEDNHDKLTLLHAYGDLQWSVEQMIMHADVREEMVVLCKRFLCEENPLFLSDVLEYRHKAAELLSNSVADFGSESSAESTAERCLLDMFTEILNTYLSPKAHLLVNVSSSASKEIHAKSTSYLRLSNDAKIGIFDRAFGEVELMLSQNLINMLPNLEIRSKRSKSKRLSLRRQIRLNSSPKISL